MVPGRAFRPLTTIHCANAMRVLGTLDS